MKILAPVLVGICLLNVFYASSQSNDNKNGFYLNGSISYRITPINLKSSSSSIPTVPVYFERDKQLSGVGVSIGGFYLLAKPRISFGISSSFRYDHIYFKNDPSGGIQDKKGLISDVHLAVCKFIPLRKNQLYIGAGYSFMNNGTTYAYSQEYITPIGDTLLIYSNSDFSYQSFDIKFGYQVGQFNFELLNRITMNHQFNDEGQLLLPEIKIGYTIALKKKQIL
ncbi:MAG: hypothetical protein JNK14_04885 [Chitinophagaceae bacterium]|nr:hypothetical protein [Chitinophagaceae bacterium]